MRIASVLALLLIASAPSPTFAKKKWGSKGRGNSRSGTTRSSAPAPPGSHDFDTVDCPKCMPIVMRLLVAGARGCPAANATVVTSSAAGRVPTAFCETMLPKKRACVAYSFGLDGTWDFDKVCRPASTHRTQSPLLERVSAASRPSSRNPHHLALLSLSSLCLPCLSGCARTDRYAAGDGCQGLPRLELRSALLRWCASHGPVP